MYINGKRCSLNTLIRMDAFRFTVTLSWSSGRYFESLRAPLIGHILLLTSNWKNGWDKAPTVIEILLNISYTKCCREEERWRDRRVLIVLQSDWASGWSHVVPAWIILGLLVAQRRTQSIQPTVRTNRTPRWPRQEPSLQVLSTSRQQRQRRREMDQAKRKKWFSRLYAA